MHKDRIAEQLLGLVTDKYRAVSTVGDLVEHSRDRGALWFWTNVLRTASALAWRAFTAEPRKIIWTSLLGTLRNFAFEILASLGFVLGGVIPFGPAYGILGPGQHPNLEPLLDVLFLAIFSIASFGMWVWVPYRAARWTAHRLPGKELTAGLVLFAMLCVGRELLGATWFPELGGPGMIAMNLIVTLAGAISARRSSAAN